MINGNHFGLTAATSGHDHVGYHGSDQSVVTRHIGNGQRFHADRVAACFKQLARLKVQSRLALFIVAHFQLRVDSCASIVKTF